MYLIKAEVLIPGDVEFLMRFPATACPAIALPPRNAPLHQAAHCQLLLCFSCVAGSSFARCGFVESSRNQPSTKDSKFPSPLLSSKQEVACIRSICVQHHRKSQLSLRPLVRRLDTCRQPPMARAPATRCIVMLMCCGGMCLHNAPCPTKPAHHLNITCAHARKPTNYKMTRTKLHNPTSHQMLNTKARNAPHEAT